MGHFPVAGFFLGLACLLAASAARGEDTLVTVSHDGYAVGGTQVPAGIFVQCRGAPTCTEEIQTSVDVPGCGAHTVVVRIAMTGLNLSATQIQGSIRQGFLVPISCTQVEAIDYVYAYSGTWNAATRTGAVTISGPSCNFQGADLCAGLASTFTGTVKADAVPPPVFPMVVTANITPVSATASAVIQYRPQDVGSSGSVYVFASAPATRVRGGTDPGAIKSGTSRGTGKAGEKAASCVIAQLNAAGELVAVTTAQLNAFLSGTLAAQGASVSILNNVPTPNVAGATFYVGYGTSAQTMLSQGIFRDAVLVPGNDVCPMLPLVTSLWWNPSEPGWGLNVSQQGATVFATLFTYDATRAPLWLVMSGGVMQADGRSFSGDLYRTTGPAFDANPFTPIGAANLVRVGTMSLAFTEANVGTLRYTVNGRQVTKTVQRQVFGSRAANCLPTTDSRAAAVNYQDLWWNSAESGWGINLTHQDNKLFATLFTYDRSGRDLWLVMSDGARQADGSFAGDLFRTGGPAFDAVPFQGVTVANVGSMRLRFADGNRGTLTYTYDGVTVNKSIERQVFASPASLCN